MTETPKSALGSRTALILALLAVAGLVGVWMTRPWTGGGPDERGLNEQWTACYDGDVGCSVLIDTLAADPNPAFLERLKESCDAGVPIACYVVGEAMMRAKDSDVPHAIGFLTAGCNSDSVEACHAAARALHYAPGGPQSWTKAKGFYHWACNFGRESFCPTAIRHALPSLEAPETRAEALDAIVGFCRVGGDCAVVQDMLDSGDISSAELAAALQGQIRCLCDRVLAPSESAAPLVNRVCRDLPALADESCEPGDRRD